MAFTNPLLIPKGSETNHITYSIAIICDIFVTWNLLFFLDYECPAGFVKCKDGLQCIHVFSMCTGNVLGPGSECKDGSDNDTDHCSGIDLWII